MTSQEFCYWLNGYFELGGETLTPEQIKIVKDHLSLTFKKETPYRVISVAVESDKPNKNGDIFTKRAWNEAVDEIMTCHAEKPIFGPSFGNFTRLSTEEYKEKFSSNPPASC